MGIGMQIFWLGLPRTASMEAEAGLQLLRPQPYGIYFSDCWLAIEHLSQGSGSLYEVRLDIAIRVDGLRRIGRCVRDSTEAAIRCAFDLALRVIRILSRHGWL